MRDEDDQPYIDQIAVQAELPTDRVRQLARWTRHVLDKLIADDFAILAPPLVVAVRSHPVVLRLGELLADPA